MRIATGIVFLLGSVTPIARGELPAREHAPLSEVVRRIDSLPRNTRYEAVLYKDAVTGRSRKLLVAVSGGIDLVEILPVLRTLQIEDKWQWFTGRWRLSVRGDAQYARVIVEHSGCSSPNVWVLTKREVHWYTIDLSLPLCEPEAPVTEVVTPDSIELP
jgi:hypothetical protein